MIILDIETPKDCYTCQFVDSEWGYCTCTVDHSIIADVLPKGVKHEKCPLKTEEECLAVATKMVMDFICKCEGSQSYLITPDGEELFTDWVYVERGLEQIMEWAKRRENAKV